MTGELDLRTLRARAPTGLAPAVLARLGLDERCAPWEGPFGPLVACWTPRGVSGLAPQDLLEARLGRRPRPAPSGLPVWLGRALEAAAAGRRPAVAVDLGGVAAFQQAVLAKTAEIPPGETRPYAWVAREIGRPAAVRAVGTALARNPVPLVVPCHRVVRADGRIGDYAFGSAVKSALLAAEGLDTVALEREAASGTRFVGTPGSGVFCLPTCGTSQRAPQRVGFASVAAAQQAGLRPCPACRPASPAASPGAVPGSGAG